jgi:hypothetical protein
MEVGTLYQVTISTIVMAAKAKNRLPPMYAIICTEQRFISVTFMYTNFLENEWLMEFIKAFISKPAAVFYTKNI